MLSEMHSMTPRKCVVDIISVGQCPLPWPCKFSEHRDKISPRVQALFSSCTIIMLQQMHSTNLSVSSEAKRWVSWPILNVEFGILCSNLWLKSEMIAWQKSIFPQCCTVPSLPSFGVAIVFFSEWLVNQHRDSAASYIGHYNLLDFFALVENEPKARVRFNLLQVSPASYLDFFTTKVIYP